MNSWCPFATRLPSINQSAGRTEEIRATVLHIAQGGFWPSINWLRDVRSQASAHFIIAKTGELVQLVGIADTAWANGLSWRQGQWYDPEGNRVQPTWPLLDAGMNINAATISIEHEGFYTEVPTPAMVATRAKLLQWIAAETGIVYVAGRTLIRHADISPKVRAFCPGPHVDLAAIAAAATQAPAVRSYARRYRVKAGGATIRQAWWRPAVGEPDNEAGKIVAGTLVDCDEIKFGMVVLGDDEWLHLADGRGFVHASALERA